MQLRDHIGDQPAPTRLVRGANPASILAVEIFIEQDVVFDVRICLHLLILLKTARRPFSSRRKIFVKRLCSSMLGGK
jgi:hypothetical protein